MPAKRINVAIVGLGGRGTSHLNIYSRLPDARVAGLCDVDQAAREKAQGDADALLIRSRAEAQANEIIRLSTTPLVLQYRALEHWDGKLPTYSAGQLPLLTFDASKLGPGVGDDATRQKALEKLLDQTKAAGEPAPETPKVGTPALEAPKADAPVP